MEDIVKHKITKPTSLVAKVLGKSQGIDHVPVINMVVPTKILLETCVSPWSPKNTEFKSGAVWPIC